MECSQFFHFTFILDPGLIILSISSDWGQNLMLELFRVKRSRRLCIARDRYDDTIAWAERSLHFYVVKEWHALALRIPAKPVSYIVICAQCPLSPLQVLRRIQFLTDSFLPIVGPRWTLLGAKVGWTLSFMTRSPECVPQCCWQKVVKCIQPFLLVAVVRHCNSCHTIVFLRLG